MLFIFDMQEQWTWNISNNYIIKFDAYIKLKYTRISLDIYQHISYHEQWKKMKKLTYQLWKHTKCLTCGSI